MNEYLIPVFLSVISTLLVLSIKGLYENLCRILLYIRFILSIQTKHIERLINLLRYHGILIAKKFDMNFKIDRDGDVMLKNRLFTFDASSGMLFKTKGYCHNFHNTVKEIGPNTTYHPEVVKEFKKNLIYKLFFNLPRGLS